MATTLEQLLANRNSWSQDINLEFCQGQKDIFRGSVPVEASSKEMFPLVPGAEIPVSLFDFELHSLFEEATVKSGCKWWCRRSRPSVAKQYVPKSLLNVVFLCRHYEKTYSKQEKDDSRTTRHLLRCGCTASCTMKAVSVRMHMPAEGLSLTSLKEILLAKKYPEVFGHDTKACANATGIPWWYSVGFREDFKTYIAMRGHICNETQPMFNFVFQAFLYIHGHDVLAACVAMMGDAKNEFINAVRSFCSRIGGASPHATLLLCGWHLTDRAIHDKFRGTKGAWSDSLYRMFWQWQRAETIEHYNAIYNWFKTTWFMSKVVRSNMPVSARDDALALIDNLHMRRDHWSLCSNIN